MGYELRAAFKCKHKQLLFFSSPNVQTALHEREVSTGAHTSSLLQI